MMAVLRVTVVVALLGGLLSAPAPATGAGAATLTMSRPEMAVPAAAKRPARTRIVGWPSKALKGRAGGVVQTTAVVSGPGGRRVLVLRKTGQTWKVRQRLNTDASGALTISLPVASSPTRWKLIVPAVKGHRRATTATRIVKPTPAPSTQTPPTLSASPTSLSGLTSMPTTDLPGWRLVFNDDFTTNVARGSFPAAVSTKWGAYPSPWKDTSRNGTYSPEIVAFENGLMDIWLHTVNGVHKVAAPVPRVPGGDQLYGRYAVRFRADPVPGYKTAWLLWPQSEVWPRDGEIDFPEGNLNEQISAFMHRDEATSGSDQDAFLTKATYPEWHTAVIEWSPGVVRFILDGAVIGTSTIRVPDQPMHWVLQTETALDGTVPTDSAQGHVQIDWVAVWTYAP